MRPSFFRSDERGLLGPNGPLGPEFSNDLLRSIVATLPFDDLLDPTEQDLGCCTGALTLLEALQPRTAVEAILAAQVIAAHHAIMDCHHQTMQGGLAEAIAAMLRNNVVGLTRSMEIVLRTLERRQARPLPPPLPPVSTALDWTLDPTAEGPPPADPPPPLRAAIVVPKIVPPSPEDKALHDARVAETRREINERMDLLSKGTPQEWYAREREMVRLQQQEAAGQGTQDPEIALGDAQQ